MYRRKSPLRYATDKDTGQHNALLLACLAPTNSYTSRILAQFATKKTIRYLYKMFVISNVQIKAKVSRKIQNTGEHVNRTKSCLRCKYKTWYWIVPEGKVFTFYLL